VNNLTQIVPYSCVFVMKFCPLNGIANVINFCHCKYGHCKRYLVTIIL